MALMVYDILGLSKEGWYIIKNLCTEMAVLLCGYITFVPAIQVWTFSQYYWSLLFILFKALSPCFPSSHFIFPSFPFPFPLQFLFSYFPFCQFPFSCSPFPVPPFTQYFKQGDTWGNIRKSSETSTLKLLARYWALHHYKSMLLCNLSGIILFFKLNRKDLTDVIFLCVSFFSGVLCLCHGLPALRHLSSDGTVCDSSLYWHKENGGT